MSNPTTTSLPLLNTTPGIVTGQDIVHAWRGAISDPALQDLAVPIDDIYAYIFNNVLLNVAPLYTTVQQLTQDVLAKIPLAEKGVANGVATLDSSGKVPASQLNLSGTAFKGNWNATTNTPTLADGTGSAGDFYIVTNGASRNLGSGAVIWTNNAYILYDGTKWIENESTNIVLSVAGKIGAVVLDANDVAEVVNKRFVTDNQRDALAGTSGIPSILNKFVTDSDPRLSGIGGTITINNEFYGIRQFEYNGINSADGQFKQLASLGLTNTTAQAKWPKTHAYWLAGSAGGINVNTANYSDVVLQEMMLTMEQGYKTAHFPDNAYFYLLLPNGHIKLPTECTNSTYRNTFRAQQFSLRFNHSSFRNYSGNTNSIIFDRMPANHTVAKSDYLDTHMKFYDGTFIGNNDIGSIGIRCCASYNMWMQGCEFYSLDYGTDLRFILNGGVENCMFSNCNSWGLYQNLANYAGTYGAADCVSQLLVRKCRANIPAGGNGYHFRGGDGCGIEYSVAETGSTTAGIGVFYDNAGNTVAKDFTSRKNHFEGSFSDAMIRARLQANCTIVTDQDWAQAPGSRYFFLDNVTGSNTAVINNMVNTSGATWTLGYTYSGATPGSIGGNGGFVFNNTMLPGNPLTAAAIEGNTAIFDAAFSSPQNASDRITIKNIRPR